jgi:hypothetical protein
MLFYIKILTRILSGVATMLLITGLALAQNMTTVTANFVTDANGALLKSGTLCFQGTDANANVISFAAGGTLAPTRTPFCAAVTNGVVASLSVPNSASTTPNGIYYTAWSQQGPTIVRQWTQVIVSGAAFSFDQWMAVNTGTGPNQFGNETSETGTGNLFRGLYVSAGNFPASLSPLGCYTDAEQGGYNQTGGPKTSYQCIGEVLVSRTQGQHFGTSVLLNSFGEGDVAPFIAYASGYGGSNAGGDEGVEAFHFEADQGNGPLAPAASNIATATINSVTSGSGVTTLGLTSGVNLDLLGELRWLIDTTAAKVYSTGTIASISGSPPVVTGSGTTWTSLTGGGYCFSLNGNANGILMQVIPVQSISSDTSLTLGYNVQGAAKPLAGLTTTGGYQIFPCSQIAAGGLPLGLGAPGLTAASVTVTNGYTGWASSDTVQLPLGFDTFISGNFVNIGPQLPMGIIPVGMHITNLAPQLWQPETWGLSIGGSFGPFSRGVQVGPGGSSNMFAAVSCEDGGLVLSYCNYSWQEHADTYSGWGWNSDSDVGKIGFDRTTGQFSVQDSTNGSLMTIDQSATLGSGRLLYNKQPTVTLASNCSTGDFSFSSGWNSPSSCVVSNDSKDQAGLITFVVGSSPTANPSVTFTFHAGAFPSRPFCIGWFSGYAGYQTQPVIPSANSTSAVFNYTGTPPGGATFTLQWSCPSGG